MLEASRHATQQRGLPGGTKGFHGFSAVGPGATPAIPVSVRGCRTRSCRARWSLLFATLLFFPASLPAIPIAHGPLRFDLAGDWDLSDARGSLIASSRSFPGRRIVLWPATAPMIADGDEVLARFIQENEHGRQIVSRQPLRPRPGVTRSGFGFVAQEVESTRAGERRRAAYVTLSTGARFQTIALLSGEEPLAFAQARTDFSTALDSLVFEVSRDPPHAFFSPSQDQAFFNYRMRLPAHWRSVSSQPKNLAAFLCNRLPDFGGMTPDFHTFVEFQFQPSVGMLRSLEACLRWRCFLPHEQPVSGETPGVGFSNDFFFEGRLPDDRVYAGLVYVPGRLDTGTAVGGVILNDRNGSLLLAARLNITASTALPNQLKRAFEDFVRRDLPHHMATVAFDVSVHRRLDLEVWLMRRTRFRYRAIAGDDSGGGPTAVRWDFSGERQVVSDAPGFLAGHSGQASGYGHSTDAARGASFQVYRARGLDYIVVTHQNGASTFHALRTTNGFEIDGLPANADHTPETHLRPVR